MAKKRRKIAQISQRTIGKTRVVGRNEDGIDITEKVPTMRGARYLDRAGSEVHIPLTSCRVGGRESQEKYGNPAHKQAIKDGFLPKLECPLTTKYEDIVHGPLIAAKPGEKKCTFTAKDIAKLEAEGEEWHGCKHYQRAKEARRQKASDEAAARRARSPEARDQAIADRLAQQSEDMSQSAAAILALARSQRGEQASSDAPAGDE